MEHNEIYHSEKNNGTFGPCLQKTDYLYNIRGWLTQINNWGNLSSENDLFAMELYYNSSGPGYGGTPLYNGNISAVTFTSQYKPDIYAYIYNYDQANRLHNSYFWKNTGENWVHDNSFDENGFTYDANGNILTLNRYADNEVKIDQLNYNYLNGGNQVSYITDAMGDVPGIIDYTGNTSTTQNYHYDLNGNMTSDVHKSIDSIYYNYLNKPELLDFGSNNKIQYIYDATGVKLAKKVMANNAILGGSSYYLGNFVYDWDKNLQYILTSEGRLVPTGNTYRYEYFMKDHLGNTRATYAAAAPGLPQVMEYQHYYPFGMQLEALGYTSGADLKNNYLYNGKELQEDYGLNWYDYGARMYDPVIGRWTTVDPLAEKYKNTSPYVYCIDNPLKYIDSDGRKIKYAPGTSEKFKKDFTTAVKYLKDHKADGILASLEKSSKVYYISEATGKISNFDPEKKTIFWASDQMLLTNKGVSLSPTSILNHEADHANQSDKHPEQQKVDQKQDNPMYGNNEEKRVITGSEQETAKKLGEIKDGEVTRTDHGGTLFPTSSPTSTEITNIPTISTPKENENEPK